jgi:hypothetical protein
MTSPVPMANTTFVWTLIESILPDSSTLQATPARHAVTEAQKAWRMSLFDIGDVRALLALPVTFADHRRPSRGHPQTTADLCADIHRVSRRHPQTSAQTSADHCAAIRRPSRRLPQTFAQPSADHRPDIRRPSPRPSQTFVQTSAQTSADHRRPPQNGPS